MLSLFLLSVAPVVSPDVILSRTEAEAMSAEQLEDLLLAGFPHDEIIAVDLPNLRPGPHGEVASPSLSYISFKERGRASGGRFCRARKITVTFDWPDGGLGKPRSEQGADDRKRLFRITGHPSVAVLEHGATDASCASLPVSRYADLSPSPEHERRLKQFLAATEAFIAGAELAFDLDCGDWRGAEEQPCNAEEALQKIDWAKLAYVRFTEWPHGVSATRITFMQSEGPHIHAYLSGTNGIERAKLTYAWPAPF